jgi:hypothetical protein
VGPGYCAREIGKDFGHGVRCQNLATILVHKNIGIVSVHAALVGRHDGACAIDHILIVNDPESASPHWSTWGVSAK